MYLDANHTNIKTVVPLAPVNPVDWPIEITVFEKNNGPLSKRIILGATGMPESDGSACVMSSGRAGKIPIANLSQFQRLLMKLASSQAIALGTLRDNLPKNVRITTKGQIRALKGDVPPDLIARTRDAIEYRSGAPAFLLIDYDKKGMSTVATQRIDAAGGTHKALQSVLPALDLVASVGRRSTSSGLYHIDTRATFQKSGGTHLYVGVVDGSDIPRALTALHKRCWLAGFGWLTVGACGQILERSIIDRTVSSPERLVFEGAPIIEPPLAQDLELRVPVLHEGRFLDTRVEIPELTEAQSAQCREMIAAARHAIKPEAERARAKYIERAIQAIIGRRKISPAAARAVVEKQFDGILLPDVLLHFDDDDLGDCTVADVLACPDKFVGAGLADPLEGVSYGRGKAVVMLRTDGTIWIHSFAHGRTTYDLRYDANAIKHAISAAPPENASDVLVQMLLGAEVAADEEETLITAVVERSKCKTRALKTRIKTARNARDKARDKAQSDARAAARTDRRVQLRAPLPDQERVPVMSALDEILSSVVEAEPPMRDLDGNPIRVRVRPPFGLHTLTADGANDEEEDKTRLPPPAAVLLTRHDEYTLAHEIEKYVEYQKLEDDILRSVALPTEFVRHYIRYLNSKLPRIGAIATAPLVLRNGTLLMPDGIDRQRGILFRIEPGLRKLMPNPEDCTPDKVLEAFKFLINEFLCDVSAAFADKCVAISAALSIVERVLLPARPAYFFTAGRRGGGKTTLINMLILATTGKLAAAAAWSGDVEERRKSLMAYFLEGTAGIVWDNIPRGTAISCPHIEASLTAAEYEDRILGGSERGHVNPTAIQSFTGNNIKARGDMCSRSLECRIEVDRPDPENRQFSHSDPIQWTTDHRGRILAALYVLLIGNQRQRHQKPSQQPSKTTRFKLWYELVGSAVEYAAGLIVESEEGLPEYERTAQEISFADMMLDGEVEDEETGGTVGAIEDIVAWRSGADPRFSAAEMAGFISDPPEGKENIAAALRVHYAPRSIDRGGNSWAITAQSVAPHLKNLIDSPVRIKGLIYSLKYMPDRAHNTGGKYHVVTVPEKK